MGRSESSMAPAILSGTVGVPGRPQPRPRRRRPGGPRVASPPSAAQRECAEEQDPVLDDSAPIRDVVYSLEDERRSQEMELVVDTGATYPVVPASVAEHLGIRPSEDLTLA